MDKIPERIYLRRVCGCDECSGKLLAGMETWSENRESDKDIEYVLASKYEELEKRLASLNKSHPHFLPKGWFLHPDNLPTVGGDNA